MVSGSVLFALAVAMFIASLGIKKMLVVGVGSGFAPRLAAVLLAWVSVGIVVKGFRALSTDTERRRDRTPGGGGLAFATFVLIVLYIGLLEKVGFIMMTFVYLIGQFYVLAPKGDRHLISFIIVGAMVALAIYYTFVKVFDLMLPAGLLG
jgi:putative tricarboxylic transport membrane protein